MEYVGAFAGFRGSFGYWRGRAQPLNGKVIPQTGQGYMQSY